MDDCVSCKRNVFLSYNRFSVLEIFGFFFFNLKKVFVLLKTKPLVSQTVAKTQTPNNVQSPVSTVEGLVLMNSNKVSD